MNNWKVWTAFVLVFCFGVTCGVLGSGVFVKQRIVKFKELKGSGFGGGKRFLRKIESQVQPDAVTMKEIRRIVAKNRKEIRQVRNEASDQILQIFTTTEQEINTLLTPEQQERFAKITERIRKRIQRIKLLRSLQK
ncbi:hypothetical protein [Halodesulfovibrio marinisediminis]|uniref:Periplasmic heavy metal sensor n=1 Tax=Halodesulfovibrio marinisediminis DSM 17456 TaxID=1121457 RepID=A0A1N6IU94_9BACT|nr:hypothetical protein [Halodesulfovibrio marinisediminis]SIO35582.1 hypothetical protein SAMN02745161_2941 [Halodesulfovibrio marinisediminis DSM 17456]